MTTSPNTKEVRDLIIGDKFQLAGSWVNVLMKHVYGDTTRLTLSYLSDGAVVNVSQRSRKWVNATRVFV